MTFSTLRIFPVERFTLVADAGPEVLVQRLRAAPFRGTIDENAFKLTPRLRYRNSFLPVVRGSFHQTSEGTRVDVDMRMLVWVRAFMAVWLSLAVAFTVAAVVITIVERSPNFLLVVAPLFVIVGTVGPRLLFRYEARRTRETLRKILVDAVPPEQAAPQPPLEWLFVLWPPALRGYDAVFNVASVALAAAAGGISVLRWETTAPTFGIWSLLVAAIALGLASRALLHWRLRRLYLVLLVAQIGLVAALVAIALSHHPRWGVAR